MKALTLRKLFFSPKAAIILCFVLVTIALSLLLVTNQKQADALSPSDWQSGNIIDDSVFYNNSTMSIGDIQAFLNQMVPNCDTNGTAIYSGSETDAQYAASQGWPGPPYVCLKDYYQVPNSDQDINNLSTNVIPNGAISAATIIKNAADTYGVNPQALLTIIQKESLNLLQDNWPLPNQYRSPMGYGCSDSAPCDPQYEGFYNQVTNAARQFRLYKNNANSYRYKSGQNNTIQYNLDTSCGTSTVYISDQATAGLYNYTPYQPNSGALAYKLSGGRYYATSYPDCAAYGNLNFWTIFTSWFGIQVTGAINDHYNQLYGVDGVLGKATMNQVCGIKNGGCYQLFQNNNAAIYWSSSTGAHAIWGGILNYWRSVNSEWSSYGLPTSDETYTSTGSEQTFENGTLYWDSATGKVFGISNTVMASEYNSVAPVLKLASSSTVCGLRNSGCYQVFQNGGAAMYQTSTTGAHTVWGGILTYWRSVNSEWSSYGYPTSDEIYTGTGSEQTFENGTIYWDSVTGSVFGVSNTAIASEYNANASVLKLASSTTSCGIKNGGCYQFFQNGNAAIYWSSSTGAHAIWGGILSYWRSIGSEWSSYGLPTSDETYTSTGSEQTFENGTIYWSASRGTYTQAH